MLFNGKFAFYQYPMLFNREALGGGEWTEGWKDGRMEIHPCVLQDIGPLGPLPKKEKKKKKCLRADRLTAIRI